MRDYQRHPEPSAPDLGLLCLRAVMADDRFDARVRRQAEQLLALSDASRPRGQDAIEGQPFGH